MNLYTVLGISQDADEETLRHAYRILARRYHPDRGAGSSSEKFCQVKEAYETLMDPGARRKYDHSLRGGEPSRPLMTGPCGRGFELLSEDPRVFGRFPHFESL